MMRVLVTGGSGLVGVDVVRRLAERGDTAIAFDTAMRDDLTALVEAYPDRVVPAPGDLTDLANVAQIFKTHRPEAVIHLAAIVGVPASLSSPSNVLRVNVQGSLNLFEAMRLFDVRRIIHLSTEEVYGDFPTESVTETTPAEPVTPYGICKLTVEQFARSYAISHGLECINLRTSWVYGLRIDRPRPPMNYLRAALEGRPLRLPTGANVVTDYTYIDDLLDGILAALDHPKHPYTVYNLASGEALSDRELIEHIKALIPTADIEVGSGRREFAPGMPIPRKGALDSSLARETFGYSPRYDIRRGLAAYAEAWRDAREASAARAS